MPTTKNRKPVAYRPADISEIPAVDALLSSLDVGALRRETVRSVTGRNDNWIGTTERDRRVFVKRIAEGDWQDRLQRSAHVARVAGDRVPMPTVLGVDEASALIALEFLPDAETIIDLALRGEFTEELAAEAGRQLAELHQLPPDGFDSSVHPLPPTEALTALPMRYWVQASSAELEMWRILQGDAELVAALHELRANDERHTDRTPIHGDLRLDQFLLSQGSMYLSDFEESRLGDPARDVGAFAGEWLFLAASALPTSLAASLPIGQSASHPQIVATGVHEIEQRAPFVRAFLAAYRRHRPAASADESLVLRATAYAGWHMLDRMLAGAARANRLSAVNKAAAGIGRTLLLAPADFGPNLGLDA
jgi:aminoglycoside phosphotransferase (APT) family kinase protein